MVDHASYHKTAEDPAHKRGFDYEFSTFRCFNFGRGAFEVIGSLQYSGMSSSMSEDHNQGFAFLWLVLSALSTFAS